MKKRLLGIVLVVALCATSVLNFAFESRAEEIGEEISFSELMTENALVGYVENITRGVYLVEGYSIINKISSTKIGAGGVTNAATKCQVSTNAIVERLNAGSWARVTSWTTTVASGYTAMVSKSLTVTNGYYYRVRCIHRASTDRSSSYTNNLWM